MKDLKLLLLIVFVAGLSNYLYSLWMAEEVYSFTIGFPLTIYYQLVIDQEPQFSYLLKNIIINVVCIIYILIFIIFYLRKISFFRYFLYQFSFFII